MRERREKEREEEGEREREGKRREEIGRRLYTIGYLRHSDGVWVWV